ncbi:DUF2271 domain-containing protein [Bowmanella pacifica]|uniref:DUF2271 domain-containing protein n=1 Tax=Bowmanella pacifica TaxID=502051 RepID=A0A917YSG9_9ALTE|nr:DUF2271 domain-containing protein [Bowmanella pacifica]GGO64389.1 hypothetical protein GCM10010982_03670 [Bowmanella pacifica]
MKLSALVLATTLASAVTHAAQLEITLNQPALDVQPYHRPYIAVWVEDSERNAVATIALWKQLEEGDKWLKDLRQYWRKIGRNAGSEVDAVTGATRRPGDHLLQWDGTDSQGKPLPAGEYLLNIEASREEGGRDYHRVAFKLGQQGQMNLPAKVELGPIQISIK